MPAVDHGERLLHKSHEAEHVAPQLGELVIDGRVGRREGHPAPHQLEHLHVERMLDRDALRDDVGLEEGHRALHLGPTGLASATVPKAGDDMLRKQLEA